ncbi:MAG: hypothetical protein WC081_00805 [Candidatus Ratteibacteria bacterium]|jgi:hypothetical protein
MNTVKRIILKVFFIGWIVALSTSYSFASSEQVPSVDFLVTSLKIQESQSSPALSVKWKTIGFINGVKTTGSREVWYVRTPKILFLESKYFKNGVWRMTNKERYEIDTNFWKAITINPSGEQTGEFGTGIQSSGLSSGDMVETVYTPVVGTAAGWTLLDLLKSGKVNINSDKKAINGIPCWVIEGNKSLGYEKDWKAYLDPAIGFCPRLIEISGPSEERTVSFEEYTQIKGGVWFPKSMVMTKRGTDANGKSYENKSVFSITDVSAGVAVSPESTSIDFPSGITLRDLDTERRLKAN